MAGADTRTAAALLLAFSSGAVLLLLLAHAELLQPPPRRLRGALADVLVLLDQLSTRGNMILLCHAILLLLLRDAGVLGTPAARRRAQGACGSAAALAPAAGPRKSDGGGRRPIESESEPASATQQAAEEIALPLPAAQIALLPDDDPDRAAIVVHRDEQTAAVDGNEGFDRRVVAGHARTAAAETSSGHGQPAPMELADDRAFEEFIRTQRRKMRQETLRLATSSGCQQAIAT